MPPGGGDRGRRPGGVLDGGVGSSSSENGGTFTHFENSDPFPRRGDDSPLRLRVLCTGIQLEFSYERAPAARSGIWNGDFSGDCVWSTVPSSSAPGGDDESGWSRCRSRLIGLMHEPIHLRARPTSGSAGARSSDAGGSNAKSGLGNLGHSCKEERRGSSAPGASRPPAPPWCGQAACADRPSPTAWAPREDLSLREREREEPCTSVYLTNNHHILLELGECSGAAPEREDQQPLQV